eukprot:g5579.t1
MSLLFIGIIHVLLHKHHLNFVLDSYAFRSLKGLRTLKKMQSTAYEARNQNELRNEAQNLFSQFLKSNNETEKYKKNWEFLIPHTSNTVVGGNDGLKTTPSERTKHASLSDSPLVVTSKFEKCSNVGFTVILSHDIQLHDISTRKGGSIDDCCEYCSKMMAACQAVVFSGGDTCWLKNSATNIVDKVDDGSGVSYLAVRSSATWDKNHVKASHGTTEENTAKVEQYKKGWQFLNNPMKYDYTAGILDYSEPYTYTGGVDKNAAITNAENRTAVTQPKSSLMETIQASLADPSKFQQCKNLDFTVILHHDIVQSDLSNEEGGSLEDCCKSCSKKKEACQAVVFSGGDRCWLKRSANQMVDKPDNGGGVSYLAVRSSTAWNKNHVKEHEIVKHYAEKPAVANKTSKLRPARIVSAPVLSTAIMKTENGSSIDAKSSNIVSSTIVKKVDPAKVKKCNDLGFTIILHHDIVGSDLSDKNAGSLEDCCKYCSEMMSACQAVVFTRMFPT